MHVPCSLESVRKGTGQNKAQPIIAVRSCDDQLLHYTAEVSNQLQLILCASHCSDIVLIAEAWGYDWPALTHTN